MPMHQLHQIRAGSASLATIKKIILAINYLLMQMPMVLAMASFANQAIEKALLKISV